MLRREGEQFAWNQSTSAGGLDLRVENPGLRMPLTFLLDDPAPLRNMMYFARAMRDYVEVVPNSFTSAFADMVERTGMCGKFSVLPYPFGLGRIDGSLTGISAHELAEFLEIVRERVTPQFDITPEMLTHWNAVDLATDRLLPYWEHDWSRRQSRATLLPYISRGLEILNNVDLPCNGVTSPWDFGHGVEDEYVPAILEAQQKVNGLGLTWYLLDLDGTSRYAPPRMMHLNVEEKTAVVSMIAGDGFDFAWRTQDGEPAVVDRLISADGSQGRLVDLARAGSPMAFHSHWQSLFSNGSAAGLVALEEVARRVAEHFGEAVRWTRCSELARIAATAAAITISAPIPGQAAAQEVGVTSPFGCPSFTLSMAGMSIAVAAVRAVAVAGRPLTLHKSNKSDVIGLPAGTWRVRDGRLYACWDLEEGATTLTITTTG